VVSFQRVGVYPATLAGWVRRLVQERNPRHSTIPGSGRSEAGPARPSPAGFRPHSSGTPKPGNRPSIACFLPPRPQVTAQITFGGPRHLTSHHHDAMMPS
jgi:hypothetical protein